VSNCDYYVWSYSNQLVRKPIEAFVMPLRRSAFDHKVFAIHVAELPQLVLENREQGTLDFTSHESEFRTARRHTL
jgi:hypothetical protein